MKIGLELLSDLEAADIEWLIEHGRERQIIANTVVFEEGVPPTTMVFILEGLLEVRVSSLPRDTAVKVGPGELLGEMAFLESRAASATIVAVENSLLLELPFDVLRQGLEQHPAFAARMYRSFALASARRLRARESGLGQWASAAGRREADLGEAWPRVESLLDEFKRALREADAVALKNQGQVSDDEQGRIAAGFAAFATTLNTLVGDASGVDEGVRESIGARVQGDVLPWLLQTRTAERLYAKPRGYAGDFLSIEWIYRNQGEGTGRLGAVLDRGFLDEPAAVAVRNRRGLLAREIARHTSLHPDRPVRITSMACGPARELFDVIDSLDDPRRLEVTLIDIDQEALAHVRAIVAERGLEQQFRLFHGNLVYLAMGRQKLDLEQQDLMYSIGLIDYFNDKFVGRLMDYAHRCLRPGGEVILGNFHPANRDKALMDYVLDWRLIHRSEEDMHRLYSASAFAKPCTRIQYEDAGVNLFATCQKD